MEKIEEPNNSIYVLCCDIGGTNLRLSLICIDKVSLEYKTIKTEKFVTNEYPSFHHFYTSKFIEGISKEYHPKLAVIGIAGAVFDNKAYMTHIIWREIDGNELAIQLKLSKIVIMNDLEAIALGVTTLDLTNIIQINDVVPTKNRPISVICVGTGFGAAYLVPDFKGDNSYEAWPSESGHANHGSGKDLQHEFYKYLQMTYRLDFVWVEKMVCGTAITDIFEFLKIKKGITETMIEKDLNLKDKNLQNIDTWNSLRKGIFEYAITDKEEICKETLNLFIEILATEVSNEALRLMPYSGIYITGTIINYIADYLIKNKETVFLHAYYLKEDILVNSLKKIPIYIVRGKCDDIGIRGCIKKVQKMITEEKKNW